MNFFTPWRPHGVEEVDAAGDVVAEIFRGIRHRLADERVGGEVHDGVGLGAASDRAR
jgi:hypothetical protein